MHQRARPPPDLTPAGDVVERRPITGQGSSRSILSLVLLLAFRLWNESPVPEAKPELWMRHNVNVNGKYKRIKSVFICEAKSKSVSRGANEAELKR